MTATANEHDIGRIEFDAPSPPASFIDRIAGRLGSGARVETIFGTPVTAGAVTVIPVARSQWGFGGGSGPQDEGSGGGGGVNVRPVGYIEIRDGKTSFTPVVDPARMVLLVALGACAVGLVLRRPR
jgi:uncharacterized spore protein YtfJ